jgi:hypothetical protein
MALARLAQKRNWSFVLPQNATLEAARLIASGEITGTCFGWLEM